ncbi:hypothetical protein SAZ11_06670 [Streptomyces sp. FXJ1.4098]|nr:hypothetical protein [Streptomyces sp. FXJ1.4098]
MTADHDTTPAQAAEELRTDGRVRERPDDPARVEAFLPAPAVQNHAANLAVLPGATSGACGSAVRRRASPTSAYGSPGSPRARTPGPTRCGSPTT